MNTKTAEEILIETINKIRRENRHLGTAEEIDPSNIDEYDKLFITTTVGIMEAYASPLKKRIEELEAALQKIQNPVRFLQDQCAKEGKSLDGVMALALSKDPVYLQEIARHALLNPSTNGK